MILDRMATYIGINIRTKAQFFESSDGSLALEDLPEKGGSDPFVFITNHTSGDKEILCHDLLTSA